MKEFACASLGNKCNWKHVARTEELLADVAAVHLRDVHGVSEIGPDLLGRIKKLFTPPTGEDAARSTDPVLKEYNCDMGRNCAWRYIAMTEELLADGAAVHAREAHGINEFTPEMIARVKKAAHAWGGEELKKTA